MKTLSCRQQSLNDMNYNINVDCNMLGVYPAIAMSCAQLSVTARVCRVLSCR